MLGNMRKYALEFMVVPCKKSLSYNILASHNHGLPNNME
jgi:hypothetical protein